MGKHSTLWGFSASVASPALVLAGLLLLVCASCAGKAKAPAGPPPLDEPMLMVEVRSSLKSAPDKALALTDEAEQRFGDSVYAEERRALGIRALVNLQRMGAARARAHGFLARYPEGSYAKDVAVWTGVRLPAGRRRK